MGRRRGRDRCEVCDLPRRHLHGAEGDDVDRVVDRVGQLGRRDHANRDTAARLGEKRKERRRELHIRGENAGAVRDRGGDETDETRDRCAYRDGRGIDRDQASEGRSRLLSRITPSLPARPAGAPVVERRLERVPGRSRGKPVARGVEIGARRLPVRLRRSERERHSHSVPVSGSRPAARRRRVSCPRRPP